MSPRSVDMCDAPLYASTPLAAGKVHEATSCNGLDDLDNRKRDANKNYENIRHINGTDINGVFKKIACFFNFKVKVNWARC